MFASRPQIKYEDILKRLPETEILAICFNVSYLPCVIKSPIRQDNRPSFGLYMNNGKVYYKDFGTKESGNLINLLKQLWNCNYQQVLENLSKIASTHKNVKTNPLKHIRTMQEHNSDVDLQCKVRNWEDYDIEYWNSYGVTLDWLKYAEVYPISHKIIVKNGHQTIFKADKYAYAFVEHKENKVTLKIYQPYNTKGYKWSNKHDRSVISLWTKIPEYGNDVVICSSLKDALCLSCNMNIPAIAIQGEGYEISDTAINELRRRYTNVYILFDNDKPGLEDSEKLAAKTGFLNVILPPFEGGKDISDMYKAFGLQKFRETMEKLFDNIDDLPF